jgi:hypothetical protein
MVKRDPNWENPIEVLSVVFVGLLEAEEFIM